ncbi:MAG: hypothetical protein QXV01_09285, partial [Candidatus Bathyarchaeia archaeon]
VEAKIIFHAASKCQFRRRLIEGVWRLIASKNVGGKIYEADLGPINSDLEEKLKMLGIEAPAEAPSKTLESKEAIMDKAGERFKRIKEYAGWGLKIKVVNGKAYLCTKSRRVGGKVVTKSLGPYDEEAKRILEKLKINVEEPGQKRSKA